MSELLSSRQKLEKPYQAIMDTAKPGDIIFFISRTIPPPTYSYLTMLNRRWTGFDPQDLTNWHTAIYKGPEKENKGARFRPSMIHSTPVSGVKKNIIPPEYIKDTKEKVGIQLNRLEIVQNQEINEKNRQEIIEFCQQQIGKSFDLSQRWYRTMITFFLGVRFLTSNNPEKATCHGLVYDAYGLVGIGFSHALNKAPNILGRILGHPLGHPRDHVDLRYNYLRDYDLYRDPRFMDVLAIEGAPEIKDVKIMFQPEKYAWDIALQIAYGFLSTK